MANTNYIDSFEVNGVPCRPRRQRRSGTDEDRQWTGMENTEWGGIVLQDLYRCPVDTDRCGGDHEHPAKRAWAAGQ